MIADSSVWISHLRNENNRATEILRATLDARQPLTLLPVVLQEVSQGAASRERYLRLLRLLLGSCQIPQLDATEVHQEAARLYMECRLAGITPRNSYDCVIAASAVLLELPLLHNDVDFLRIASVEKRLKLLPV